MATEEYRTALRSNYAQLLQEASQFYMAKGDVYGTLRRLAERLEEEKIPYALIEGMALAARFCAHDAGRRYSDDSSRSCCFPAVLSGPGLCARFRGCDQDVSRHRDQCANRGDYQPLDFADRLDPSVQTKFRELWNGANTANTSE